MINKFSRVYITYDLDAHNDVSKSLERIGLNQDADFCGIGTSASGSDCIEGLVPASIKKKVFSEHFETVAAMGSQESNARRSAKNKIKAEFLKEFRQAKFDSKELALFKALFAKIGKAFK